MTRPLLLAAACASILAFAPAVHGAEKPASSPPEPKPPPANALSVQLLSLLGNGLALQYERHAARSVSVATSLGHRWSGGDQFDTIEGSFGAEGRYWLFGKGPLTRWSGPAMVGPYVGFRLDGALTRVTEGERFVGGAITIAESVVIGARVVFLDRIEVTPSFGVGYRQEIDPRGRLATRNHFDVSRFGLTAGVMF